MQSVVVGQPDDWHVHFREGEMLDYTVPATAQYFRRALVMPNLKKPLTSLDALLDYHKTILKASKKYSHFKPYLSFYLNEGVLPEALAKAKAYDFILGAKLYPAGVTTHSEAGARSIESLYPLFECMQANDLVLQIHGEEIRGDIFDREGLFISLYLKQIMQCFPKLRIVLEHISTKVAVEFVEKAPETLAATITPHHLLYNRNQLLAGGIRPHYYCLPILKRLDDQRALQRAATSGNPKFFAGTDSAPHDIHQKECALGCAGIYSAPFALSMYAEVFDAMDALKRLNPFLSQFGAQFYRLPVLDGHIELIREAIQVPMQFHFGAVSVVPVHAGGAFSWSVR